jgi:phosphohistidine phosphatase SixA
MSHYIGTKGTPDIIFHSPLLRAEESAQEAEKILQPKFGRSVFLPLENKIPGHQLYQALQYRDPRSSEPLIVGHHPQLDWMLDHLGVRADIKPGGIVIIQFDGAGKVKQSESRNPLIDAI